MGTATATTTARRAPVDKHDERRKELAESALRTLGELGYAKASLREIAQNSEYSHGVVHYYFEDKLELIIYCVRYYKARCVRRYDDVVEESRTPEELTRRFADKLVETIVEEAPMHRLWYDLRTQCLFEDGLQEAVLQIDGALEEMVWRVIARYAELSGLEPAMSPHVAYGMLDGMFHQTLLAYTCGIEGALDDLRTHVVGLMPMLLRQAA